jgi:hypothetical protein
VEYQTVLGALSVIVGLVGFALYFRSIYQGQTKPHAFTWISFTLLDGIAFSAQVVSGAGPGSWALGLGTIMCAAVSVVVFFVGHVKIKKTDRVSFVCALIGITLWVITDVPLYAVILAALVNILGTIPTIRKSYDQPGSETITLWSIDIFRYGLSLFALQTVNVTTVLVPIAIVIGNSAVIATVLFKRRKVRS